MPWGKYGPKPRGSGLLMQDVPAGYLHWLWHQGKKHDKQCSVADYIRRNLTALEQELPDAIW